MLAYLRYTDVPAKKNVPRTGYWRPVRPDVTARDIFYADAPAMRYFLCGLSGKNNGRSGQFNIIAPDVPLLCQFQSWGPLTPLLYEECYDRVRGIMMRRFVIQVIQVEWYDMIQVVMTNMKSAKSVLLLMAIKLSEDDFSNLKVIAA